MAIYNFENNHLQEIEKTTFSDEGILERQHLQSALKNQINVIAPECLIISEEFSEWSGSQRRIDLLAINKDANLVVIELKRNETGEHMELQAIRYASMVSTLTFKRATEIFQSYLNKQKVEKNSEEEILQFLGWEEPQEDDFALDINIILVSSNFSRELTTSVMWLNERDLNIKCIRLIPYKHNNQLLIDVQQIIPLPEAESYQIKIRQQSEERREARKTSKDYTKYIFKGSEYNKRKLVLAVIQTWITENNPSTFSHLIEAFPLNIHRSKLFVPLDEAKATYERQNIPRHFMNDDEVIEFSPNEKYAISNQWGKGNIEAFINNAKNLGYEID